MKTKVSDQTIRERWHMQAGALAEPRAFRVSIPSMMTTKRKNEHTEASSLKVYMPYQHQLLCPSKTLPTTIKKYRVT